MRSITPPKKPEDDFLRSCVGGCALVVAGGEVADAATGGLATMGMACTVGCGAGAPSFVTSLVGSGCVGGAEGRGGGFDAEEREATTTCGADVVASAAATAGGDGVRGGVGLLTAARIALKIEPLLVLDDGGAPGGGVGVKRVATTTLGRAEEGADADATAGAGTARATVGARPTVTVGIAALFVPSPVADIVNQEWRLFLFDAEWLVFLDFPANCCARTL